MKLVVVPNRDVPAAGQVNHHACASQTGGDVKLTGDVVNARIQRGHAGGDTRVTAWRQGRGDTGGASPRICRRDQSRERIRWRWCTHGQVAHASVGGWRGAVATVPAYTATHD